MSENEWFIWSRTYRLIRKKTFAARVEVEVKVDVNTAIAEVDD